MTAAVEFLEHNRERHLSELAELLRFASISTLERHRGDLLGCAEWIAARLRGVGLEHVDLLETGGNPIVYADWLHASDAPTALLYGHYDVQPADPVALWETPPFEPTIRGDRLYARGASDNKGPLFVNVAALEALLWTDGRLPCNVRVIVEGEEELRADRLSSFIGRSTRLLAADVAVISDASQFAQGIPGLSLGLRGMAALQLTLRTAQGDLHSGVYGGVAPNAVHALAKLLSSLHEDGRIAVAGFYDRVRQPADAELASWRRLRFDEAAVGARPVGESGFTPFERMWARPSLDVHGIWGGFVEEGIKTVIPAEAHAKLSCRLVPDQEPEEVIELLVAHLRRRAGDVAEVTIDWTLPGARPYATPPDHPAVEAGLGALAAVYGREAVLFRAGWSVPVTDLLARHMGLDSLLLGFAHPDENAHAPNEFFRVSSFTQGTRVMEAFWRRLAVSPDLRRRCERRGERHSPRGDGRDG